MTEDDVLRIIKEHLAINVKSEYAGGFTRRQYHTVQLLLDGEIISESYLPDTKDD